MITEMDSIRTVEFQDHFVILPTEPLWDEDKYIQSRKGKKVPAGFRYCSGTNSEWLSIDQIRKLITDHVDLEFRV